MEMIFLDSLTLVWKLILECRVTMVRHYGMTQLRVKGLGRGSNSDSLAMVGFEPSSL